MTTPPYRGRFAPSPTGPLHFGSLVAALGSCLDARSHGGEWLLRMEDLDTTREVTGAADLILTTLEGFGFAWDGPVIYQSRRRKAYEEALHSLLERGLAYPCGCSRREIAESAATGEEGPIYPGTCRSGLAPGRRPRSIRLLTRDDTLGFEDRIQGLRCQNPAREVGDFVIRRADGLHAYQLAVVVDDAWQGISHVVRGADLLASTPRQKWLQQALELASPGYAHLPLAVDSGGRKLSKHYRDAPVDPRRPLPGLLQALAFLRQPLPPQPPADLDEFWKWAVAHWSIATVPPRWKLVAEKFTF